MTAWPVLVALAPLILFIVGGAVKDWWLDRRDLHTVSQERERLRAIGRAAGTGVHDG